MLIKCVKHSSPAEKNSTGVSAASAAFSISEGFLVLHRESVGESAKWILLPLDADWVARHGLQRQCEDNVKTATGVKNWVAFCKILVESIFVMLEEDPQDWFNGATKKELRKRVERKRTLSSTRIPKRILSLSPRKILPLANTSSPRHQFNQPAKHRGKQMLFKNSRSRNVFVAELTLISRWALHSPSLQRRWENKFSNFVLIKRNCSQFTFSGKGKGRVIFHWPFSPEQLLAGRLSLPGVEGDEEFQRWYFCQYWHFCQYWCLCQHTFFF